MGIWLIARNNIKKKKGNAIILFLMIAFDVMLLYVGISVLTNMYTNIDKRNELINGADFVLVSQNTNESMILDIITEENGVLDAEAEDGLYQTNVKYALTGTEAKDTDRIDFLFQKKDVDRNITTVNVIDEGKEWLQDSIILPYYMKVVLGYQTGDVISLEVGEIEYHFTVYGFMDDIMFSTPTNISIERVFIDNRKYEELEEEWKQSVHIYKAKIDPSVDSQEFESIIDDKLKVKVSGYLDNMNQVLNYSTMRIGASLTALIFMAILTVFAILLILISMIIINFNINHSIEMNIKNIGILQAGGYTRRQLLCASVLEIMMIAILGVVAGLLLARVTTNVIGGIVAAAIGMLWGIIFDLPSAVYSTLISLIMVFLAAYIGSSKYKNINVLDALRNGIKTHNFKKSNIKLDRSKLPVNLLLGLKNIMSRKVKNIIIVFIIAFLTFCANSAFSMYQNFVKDNNNLLNVTGFEIPTLGITFTEDNIYTNEDYNELVKKINSINGVEEVKQYNCFDMTCYSITGKENLNCDIYDDVNLRVDNVVEGRRPVNKEEVMLSTVMAKRLEVSTGDVVYLQLGEAKEDFIVCGMFQGINHLGKKALLLDDGAKRLNDGILPYMLYVYGNNQFSPQELSDIIQEEIEDENLKITNFQDYITSSLMAVTTIMELFSKIIIVSVGLVIALVLMLLVKTQLAKDKRQYGIYKALGYTTGQLLLQTTMNYIPVILVGSLLGCIATHFLNNAFFVACMSIFGIQKCNMKLSLPYMLIIFIGIATWSQLIILINSLKVRKIVPCEMIQEE